MNKEQNRRQRYYYYVTLNVINNGNNHMHVCCVLHESDSGHMCVVRTHGHMADQVRTPINNRNAAAYGPLICMYVCKIVYNHNL